MASWMIHLRVAQALLDRGIPGVGDYEEGVDAFLMGNLAPDSGILLPTGGYSPDKTTSHFMRRFENVPPGENPERCDPRLLAESWLLPSSETKDPAALGFYTGYLAHLVTDNAWVREMIYPAKLRFAHLRLREGVETPEGVSAFYEFLKRDWQDLDLAYLRDNPPPPAYERFLVIPPFLNTYLPFFPPYAFEQKRPEVQALYHNGGQRATQRPLYITQQEAETFVQRTAEEVLEELEGLSPAFSPPKLVYS